MTYRFFFLDAGGHVVGADMHDCNNDAHAEAHAGAAVARRGSESIEVWDGPRRVAIVRPAAWQAALR